MVRFKWVLVVVVFASTSLLVYNFFCFLQKEFPKVEMALFVAIAAAVGWAAAFAALRGAESSQEKKQKRQETEAKASSAKKIRKVIKDQEEAELARKKEKAEEGKK